MLTFAMLATIRCRANASPPPNADQPDADALDLICRVAIRLAQRRIRPAHVIAWSLWRRAHQATAQRSHLKHKVRL
jgi:hypothetical protein